VQGISVLEWGPGSAPIGKVLDETLETLGPLDRHLLLFSSTSSLTAVRWLLHLGACWDASDANGSTCLHVACRAGGISVVMEHMQHKPLLEAADVASWTPLHIASHMGRREAVIRLLAAGASPHRRNAAGHTPAQICIDQSTKDALLRECWSSQEANAKLSSVGLNQVPRNDSMGIPIECEPELFFVTPEAAIRDTDSIKAKLLHLAVRIFNLQPSFGLAFVVASGLTDSYTAAMKMILRSGEASRRKVGAFLGATFSLCPLVRFGIFDSMALLHTGVVSALVLAFHAMQLPDDLQMIDRLVRGVALVWWRKHRADAQSRHRAESSEWIRGSGELAGHELLQYLASSDVLAQLMFSTVLLHWFVHRDGRGRRRNMPAESWLALNRGIENGGLDVPDHVQLRIHAMVTREFIAQLSLALSPGGLLSSADVATDAAKGPAGGVGLSPLREGTTHSEDGMHRLAASSSALAPAASMEGWVQLLNGEIIYPSSKIDLYASVPEACCRFEGSGLHDSVLEDPVCVDCPESQALDRGFVWVSLCYVLLLFSVRPASDAASAPYAVVDARRVRIMNVDAKTLVVTFVGQASRSEDTREGAGNTETEPIPVTVVILLPDGRWREMNLPKLEMKFPRLEDMHAWVAKLIRGPLSCKTHAL